jgi:hypothetical protein
MNSYLVIKITNSTSLNDRATTHSNTKDKCVRDIMAASQIHNAYILGLVHNNITSPVILNALN